MTVATRIPLGAPGLYELPDEPIRRLTAERMDVCAFIGIAPRGPARVQTFEAVWAPRPAIEGASVVHSVPVAVESWGAYRQLFGGFEGPGRLPYAVAAFFENGGRRAYVVRVVHDDGIPPENRVVATSSFPGLSATLVDGTMVTDVRLRARNEGAWGNGLRATLSFQTRPLSFRNDPGRPTELFVERSEPVGAGTTLRAHDTAGARTMFRVQSIASEWKSGRVRERWAVLDGPVPANLTRVEVVEGALEVLDGAGNEERWSGLGLASAHPRWLAAVLVQESRLLYPWIAANSPEARWYGNGILNVPETLAPFTSAEFTGGTDAYDVVTPEDFYDPGWVLGNEDPGRGVHALVALDDLSLLVAPDLYSPGALIKDQSVTDTSAGSGEFEVCPPDTPRPQQAPPVNDLPGLALDPMSDLDRIAELQQVLVDLAEDLQSFVVLLDVPPGLTQRRILDWRSRFTSMWAAAYHPWLDVARPDDQRDALIRINPSAFAAGITARQEIAFGVAHGPANALAFGATWVADVVSDERHDQLHPMAINVYRIERDGILLTAARTLSTDRDYRQLSVRRLVSLLRRALARQMQGLVFEPNDHRLRADVVHVIRAFLMELFRAGAFAGSRPDESFFVKCDDELNPPVSMNAGRLVAHIGVAPAEPLEFIVLQLVREGDGTVRLEE
jgi:hypothetical protein